MIQVKSNEAGIGNFTEGYFQVGHYVAGYLRCDTSNSDNFSNDPSIVIEQVWGIVTSVDEGVIESIEVKDSSGKLPHVIPSKSGFRNNSIVNLVDFAGYVLITPTN